MKKLTLVVFVTALFLQSFAVNANYDLREFYVKPTVLSKGDTVWSLYHANPSLQTIKFGGIYKNGTCTPGITYLQIVAYYNNFPCTDEAFKKLQAGSNIFLPAITPWMLKLGISIGIVEPVVATTDVIDVSSDTPTTTVTTVAEEVNLPATTEAVAEADVLTATADSVPVLADELSETVTTTANTASPEAIPLPAEPESVDTAVEAAQPKASGAIDRYSTEIREQMAMIEERALNLSASSTSDSPSVTATTEKGSRSTGINIFVVITAVIGMVLMYFLVRSGYKSKLSEKDESIAVLDADATRLSNEKYTQGNMLQEYMHENDQLKAELGRFTAEIPVPEDMYSEDGKEMIRIVRDTDNSDGLIIPGWDDPIMIRNFTAGLRSNKRLQKLLGIHYKDARVDEPQVRAVS